MPEIYSVIEKRPLTYEGLFKPDELFKLIKRFCSERGYFPLENKNFEEVYEHGRQITIDLKPFKQLSDYLKQEMWISIKMSRLVDKVIEIDGLKQKMMHGKVTIVFDAQIISDLQSKWEGTGWLYFIRLLNDKFIRKDWVSEARTAVARDTNDLLDEIKSFLNMVRFKVNQE